MGVYLHLELDVVYFVDHVVLAIHQPWCACRGRFDVFEDDTDLESPGNHGGLSRSEDRKDRELEREISRKPNVDRERTSREEHRDHRRHESEQLRQVGRSADELASRHRERASMPSGERAVLDQRPANGAQGGSRPSSGTSLST